MCPVRQAAHRALRNNYPQINSESPALLFNSFNFPAPALRLVNSLPIVDQVRRLVLPETI